MLASTVTYLPSTLPHAKYTCMYAPDRLQRCRRSSACRWKSRSHHILPDAHAQAACEQTRQAALSLAQACYAAPPLVAALQQQHCSSIAAALAALQQHCSSIAVAGARALQHLLCCCRSSIAAAAAAAAAEAAEADTFMLPVRSADGAEWYPE